MNCRHLVYPGTVQAATQWPGRAIRLEHRVDQRGAERFRRDGDVERDDLWRDDALRLPGLAAVKRAVEGDHIRRVIIPCNIQLAVRADCRRGADGAARPGRVVGARYREARPMIRRAADANAAANRATCRRVPGDIDVISERASEI